jgi:radical SAM superfamily enzyme YgiQ (UPF0313 family)
MKIKKQRVVICLPAYKAERTLAKTVADIPKGIADELILVDDASPDNTVKEAKRLGLKPIIHKSNKGYGGNQKTCYNQALAAGADIIVLLHPDYQYDPKTIPDLIRPLKEGKADFVFGSRFAGGGNPLKGGMPFYRYLGNKITTFFENIFLGTNFSELHSGLKSYTREFLESIPHSKYSDKFVFDSQMLIDAVLNGFKIIEVPIPTRYAEDSSSVDIYNSLKYIFQTFWELIKRKYFSHPEIIEKSSFSKKKILLFNPPGKKLYLRDYYCSKISKANYLYAPPDLLILSGILAQKYQVKVLDAIAEKLSPNECLKKIFHLKPEAIIFLSGQVSFLEDFAFLKRVKKKLRTTKLIGSGDIFMENGKKIMAENSFIDAILLDFTTPDILDYLAGKKRLKNMVYRHQNQIIEGETERIKGAEFKIPIPKHELFPNHLYQYPFIGKPFATVLTDYGCPFSCKFCIMGEIGFKLRPLDDVIKELEYIKSLNIKDIYFDDQTFAANRMRTEKLLKKMIKLKLDLRWCCFSRVDVVDKRELQLMKRAGCHTIMFGVESANPEILKKYHKGFTKKQVVEIFKLCRKLGIKTLGTFMLGFPEELEKSVLETISFAKKLNPDFASFNIPVPRAGTELRKEMINENPVFQNPIQFDQTGMFITKGTKQLPKEKLIALRKKAILSFYLRPGYLLRRFFQIKSHSEFKQNISEAIALLRSV